MKSNEVEIVEVEVLDAEGKPVNQTSEPDGDDGSCLGCCLGCFFIWALALMIWGTVALFRWLF